MREKFVCIDNNRDFKESASNSPVVVEVQGQYLSCFSLCCDFSQTVSGEEIKYADLSVHTASNHTEVDESQRFDLPAEKSAFSSTFMVKRHIHRPMSSDITLRVRRKDNGWWKS